MYLKKISEYLNLVLGGFEVIKIVMIIYFFSVLIAGVDNGKVVVQPIKKVKVANLEKINAGSNLTCIRQVLELDQFATGGNENPLKIWDLETGKISFTAKSVSLI